MVAPAMNGHPPEPPASDGQYTQTVDASGLNCPLPLLKAKKALAGMASGEALCVIATDPGALQDFTAFAAQSGNRLLAAEQRGAACHFVFVKK